ncbi:MAG: preprotein translocase subunit SecG [Phycisphaerae bacterium]
MDYFLGTLFVLICILLIIVVLLQKGRGGGLGAAFGGAGSSAFGTRTGDVFTWVTIVLTSLFLILSVGVTLLFRPPPKAIEAPTLVPPPQLDAQGKPVPIAEDTWVEIRGPSKATIYYTTDGSVPNENSPICDKASVKISPGTVLLVRAFKGGRWSETVGGLYAKKAPETQTAPTTASGPATSGVSLPPGTAPTAETVPARLPASGPVSAPAAH